MILLSSGIFISDGMAAVAAVIIGILTCVFWYKNSNRE